MSSHSKEIQIVLSHKKDKLKNLTQSPIIKSLMNQHIGHLTIEYRNQILSRKAEISQLPILEINMILLHIIPAKM